MAILNSFSEKFTIQSYQFADPKQGWKISIILVFYVINFTFAHMHQYFLEQKLQEIKLSFEKKKTNLSKDQLIEKIK